MDRFNHKLIKAIGALMVSCSDNQLKSDELTKMLKPYGFKPEGLGTNIMVYTHKKDEKRSVVYKIALDEYGVQNNFDDIQLSEDIPEFVRVYEVEKTGLISVQEHSRAFKSLAEIQPYYKKIFKILNRLSKGYLIVDLSPDNIKNYGVNKKKELKIIDGSDLVPLDNAMPLTCRGIVFNKKGKREVCNHQLVYDDEYKKLVCERCSREYNPLEFKRKLKEVNIMKGKFFSDGLDERERLALDKYVEKLRKESGKADGYSSEELKILFSTEDGRDCSIGERHITMQQTELHAGPLRSHNDDLVDRNMASLGYIKDSENGGLTLSGYNTDINLSCGPIEKYPIKSDFSIEPDHILTMDSDLAKLNNEWDSDCDLTLPEKNRVFENDIAEDDESEDNSDWEEIFDKKFGVDQVESITDTMPNDYDGDNLELPVNTEESEESFQNSKSVLIERIKKSQETVKADDDESEEDSEEDDFDSDKVYEEQFSKTREKKRKIPMKMKTRVE